VELFKLLLKWRAIDPESRHLDALALVPLVRLPLISPEYLCSLVKPSGLVPLEPLFEAMTFHANPDCLRTSHPPAAATLWLAPFFLEVGRR
jgi:hypothetical protein